MKRIVKNELEARNLNSYSWEELKIIADDLSVNGRDSEYYTDVFEMTHDGSAKTFTTGSDILGEKMKVRIIGVCQDVKEDGTMAGLTFQTTHTLATTHAMNEDGTNADGWGKSSMREWLNNTVYDALPDELRENIVGVKKYYRNNAFGDDATIVNVVDKVFLASFKELYGYVELGQSWYEQEGTGENHNEQYLRYELNDTDSKHHGLLNNMYADYDGNNLTPCKCWGARTVFGNKFFASFRGTGGDFYAMPDHETGVVPVFAL